MNELRNLVLWVIPVLLSLTVHEWAHAASARALGDDTAERLGRLTLNPTAHIDPIGTVLLPLLQVIASGTVYFAWAKPVPVSPVNFRRNVSMSTGMMLVSAAGPLSNLLLSLGAAIGLGFGARLGVLDGALLAFLRSMLVLNLALAIFNLIPLPPLDGSKVLLGMLPRRAALAYERIFPYAPFLLLAVFLFGGSLIRVPVGILGSWLVQLSAAIAG